MMTNSSSKRVCCYGEVLWDVFPDHEKIGGAPLNVALRIHSFGIPTVFISRIGKDIRGEGIRKFLKEQSLDASHIQTDASLATGMVKVELDLQGSASYEITHPVAWDAIAASPEAMDAARYADVFVFGSLVCRDQRSKSTLFSLLDLARLKVFDVNLRPPHYSMSLLEELMKKSDFIKCNDEELVEICTHLKIKSKDIKEQVRALATQTDTPSICITLGAKGALLYTNDKFYQHDGYSVTVKDTVGAGDSFLGTLISTLLIEKQAPEMALSYACAVGALVASKEGANPKIITTEIEAMLRG